MIRTAAAAAVLLYLGFTRTQAGRTCERGVNNNSSHSAVNLITHKIVNDGSACLLHL